MITSLATGVIAQAASPTKDSIKQAEQNELATKQSDGKKALKKKLALDYTNPKFSSDLNQSQKDAILKSLKKWKLDLPVNNTFTVTSISDLKKNQKVVYMWAVTPNANWDNSRPYNVEDYEEGDPRFVRTEFNVLLKKSSNGWKATLEQDNELKTELPSIPESEVTTEEKNVLFGANKSENIFTDRNEVLVEANSSNSSSSSSVISNVSSSSVNNSQINSSSPSSIPASSTQSVSSSVSSKTVGLLDVLFGSPRVSAGATDYSWPWANGQQYYIGQGWHGDYTYYGRNDNGTFYGTPNGINVTGYALDMQPYNGASTDVLAPVSGTIQRSCVDPRQSHLKFEKMGILHIATAGITNATSVTKNQKLGNVFNPAPYFNVGQTYSGLCGTTGKTHLHIAILDNQIIDGTTFSYNTNYNPVPIPGTANNTVKIYTSQNTPPAQGVPNVNLYWRNNNGTNVRYVMNGGNKIQDTQTETVTSDWKIGAIADFNNDGNDDILWRNNNGDNTMWFMNSSGFKTSVASVQFVDPVFDIVGAADFNNDGKQDIIWRNKVSGVNVIWYMNNNNHIGDGLPPAVTDLPFEIVGTGDYNGDGKADLFWRNRNTNENVIWYMNNASIIQSVSLGSAVGSNWGIAGTIDYNGDGKPDIIWRDKNNGQNTIWYMNNATQIGALNIMSIPTDWKLEVKN